MAIKKKYADAVDQLAAGRVRVLVAPYDGYDPEEGVAVELRQGTEGVEVWVHGWCAWGGGETKRLSEACTRYYRERVAGDTGYAK